MKRKIRLQRGTPNNLKLEEFEVRVKEIEKTQGEKAAERFRNKWRKENVTLNLTPEEWKKEKSLRLKAKKSGDWGQYNIFMETMEKKGIVGQANHVGKREIL